jgi:hypothetical protein
MTAMCSRARRAEGAFARDAAFHLRHCEERSDAAIRRLTARAKDWIASLRSQ